MNLKNCPACQSLRLDTLIHKHGLGGDDLHYVVCLDCGIRTSDFLTEAQAIFRWNDRRNYNNRTNKGE